MREMTKDGRETASLQDDKVDRSLIENLLARIRDHTYKNISGVVIVKNGQLVVEEYFPRDDQGTELQQLHSVTKSVTSILIGIAIEQGLIRGVDEKISTFFPEYADLFSSDEKAELSLKNFLSMSAGLAWDEWNYLYTDPRNDAVQTRMRADPIRYVLEKPIAATPGAKFVYNSGVSMVLGEIIRKVSSLRADKFAERYLFEPLGISNYKWTIIANDVVETGGGLFLRPRDLAKLGQLFLNGGRWQERPMIGESWIKESTTNHAGAMKLPLWMQAADGYGYHWWLGSLKAGDNEIRFYSARGRGGQYLAIIPDCQLVTVVTGLNDNILLNQPLNMLQRYILPAIALPS
jgi:CubicO group peptidase (beta-lactamase class C family)